MRISSVFLLLLLNGCAGLDENQLASIGAGALVGYGLYEISKNSEGSTYAPVYYLEDDCRNFYQNFQGCCSWHVGVAGCYNYYVICNDWTISPSCRCNTYYCVAY